jgi:hypothetical protein
MSSTQNTRAAARSARTVLADMHLKSESPDISCAATVRYGPAWDRQLPSHGHGPVPGPTSARDGTASRAGEGWTTLGAFPQDLWLIKHI